MDALTPTNPPPSDDGFSSTSHQTDRAYLKWTDTLGWHDRNGNKLPSPLLVWKLTEFAGHWEDTPEGKRQLLREPLEELGDRNAKIPESQWKLGQNGKPEAPWKHFVGIYFVDPATGKRFRYEHCTWGAKMMHADLKEAVQGMRLLRGDPNCLPVVHPTDVPWKVDTGLRKRPVLEILGYKTPGGDHKAVEAKPVTPQLTGPTTTPVETPAAAPSTSTPAKAQPADNWKPPQSVATPAQPQQTEPKPAQPQQAQPKPAVNLAATETLNAMGDVKPATTSEIMGGDEVPW